MVGGPRVGIEKGEGSHGMTDAATRPAAARRAPSPAAVGAGLAVGLLTAMLLRIRTTPDVDLWLHLRIGDLLNAGQQFGSGPDPLAALADRPYVPTQWLAQRAMAWTWSAAGMTGIQVVRLLLYVTVALIAVVALMLCLPIATEGEIPEDPDIVNRIQFMSAARSCSLGRSPNSQFFTLRRR